MVSAKHVDEQRARPVGKQVARGGDMAAGTARLSSQRATVAPDCRTDGKGMMLESMVLFVYAV